MCHMCITYIMYMWCFRCITHVIHSLVIHMFHYCNTGVYQVSAGIIYMLANVPHVYDICDTHVIHVWCFRCITHVILSLVIHMFHYCNTGVYQVSAGIIYMLVNVPHVYDMWYTCNTCVKHLQYTCFTFVILVDMLDMLYMCGICVLHMYIHLPHM